MYLPIESPTLYHLHKLALEFQAYAKKVLSLSPLSWAETPGCPEGYPRPGQITSGQSKNNNEKRNVADHMRRLSDGEEERSRVGYQIHCDIGAYRTMKTVGFRENHAESSGTEEKCQRESIILSQAVFPDQVTVVKPTPPADNSLAHALSRPVTYDPKLYVPSNTLHPGQDMRLVDKQPNSRPPDTALASISQAGPLVNASTHRGANPHRLDGGEATLC
ncbi:hypothetical protein EGW08_006687 [Elysia chlorotica]|uniref:Uncharacterized protein n=1 Tax=Elysia chlorotica TaxID=188477 RepID=A0A433TVF2_ELYCH|nr:hypothetical protein EGW08_006687 [Elysia chlorotica]